MPREPSAGKMSESQHVPGVLEIVNTAIVIQVKGAKSIVTAILEVRNLRLRETNSVQGSINSVPVLPSLFPPRYVTLIFYFILWFFLPLFNMSTYSNLSPFSEIVVNET